MTTFQPGLAIHRFEIPVDGRWHRIGLNCDPLSVGCRVFNVVEFWAVESGLNPAVRAFRIVGTGESMPDHCRYWGTAVTPDGQLVWHLVELI